MNKMATEKRLIDANKLPYSIAVDDNGKQIFYVKAEDIDKAPTVDAVEVVRCKDCEHWNKRYETKGICMNHSNAVLCFTKPDFYCACGERKSNG